MTRTETNKKLISLVVPVLNEEENVEVFHAAVVRVMAPLLDRYDYEMVFTDNHSTDRTFEKLEAMARRDPRIRVLRFSRNFGYQRSIYTGYMNAQGASAIQLDCDMQDPPELIPEFLKKWEEGHKVVYGVRRTRQERWDIQILRKAFYRLIDRLSDDPLPHDAGDFRLVDRRVIDELKKIEDHQPYLRGSIAVMGFDQTGIPYDRAERARGQSKFSWASLLRLAIDGILNHSIVPLRISTYIGLTVSVLTVFGLIGYIIGKIFFGTNWPTGFATTTALILLSLSLNSLFLGVIGEYIGRIYQQVKKRPITIIEKTVHFPGSGPE